MYNFERNIIHLSIRMHLKQLISAKQLFTNEMLKLGDKS